MEAARQNRDCRSRAWRMTLSAPMPSAELREKPQVATEGTAQGPRQAPGRKEQVRLHALEKADEQRPEGNCELTAICDSLISRMEKN